MGLIRYTIDAEWECDGCRKNETVHSEGNRDTGATIQPKDWHQNPRFNTAGCSDKCWGLVEAATNEVVKEVQMRLAPEIERRLRDALNDLQVVPIEELFTKKEPPKKN